MCVEPVPGDWRKPLKRFGRDFDLEQPPPVSASPAIERSEGPVRRMIARRLVRGRCRGAIVARLVGDGGPFGAPALVERVLRRLEAALATPFWHGVRVRERPEGEGPLPAQPLRPLRPRPMVATRSGKGCATTTTVSSTWATPRWIARSSRSKPSRRCWSASPHPLPSHAACVRRRMALDGVAAPDERAPKLSVPPPPWAGIH